MSQVLLENVSDRPYTVRLAGEDTEIPAGHAIVCEEGSARLYVPWGRDSQCPPDDTHKIGPHARFNSDAEYDRYLRRFRHRHGYFDGKPQDFDAAEKSEGVPFKPPLRIRPYTPQPVVVSARAVRVVDTAAEEFAGLGASAPESVTTPAPKPTSPSRPRTPLGKRGKS